MARHDLSGGLREERHAIGLGETERNQRAAGRIGFVGGTERVQQGELTFAGETDSVYRTSDLVTLHDPALGRRLLVRTEGAANIVVWNPWAAKAKEVPDIGDDDWERFVCIEGANAFENAVVLAPGASHSTTYRLEVQPL